MGRCRVWRQRRQQQQQTAAADRSSRPQQQTAARQIADRWVTVKVRKHRWKSTPTHLRASQTGRRVGRRAAAGAGRRCGRSAGRVGQQVRWRASGQAHGSSTYTTTKTASLAASAGSTRQAVARLASRACPPFGSAWSASCRRLSTAARTGGRLQRTAVKDRVDKDARVDGEMRAWPQAGEAPAAPASCLRSTPIPAHRQHCCAPAPPMKMRPSAVEATDTMVTLSAGTLHERGGNRVEGAGEKVEAEGTGGVLATSPGGLRSHHLMISSCCHSTAQHSTATAPPKATHLYSGSGCSVSSSHGSPLPLGPGEQHTPSSTICGWGRGQRAVALHSPTRCNSRSIELPFLLP